MPTFLCRNCGREQRLSVFERTCNDCGGTDLEPAGEVGRAERV